MSTIPDVTPEQSEQPEPQPPEQPSAPKQPLAFSDNGILIRSLAELYRFSEMVLKAGAAPKGIDTIGKVAVAIQMGMERGMKPLGGLRAVYFVNGLPSWRGEAAVALVRNSPLCRHYAASVEGEGDERKGVCVTHRAGERDAVRTEFSVRDAKKAGLWSKEGPWQSYPDRQLKWRAIGFNLKDQFSDILGGFPIAEEAADLPSDAIPDIVRTDRLALAPPPSAPDPLLSQLGVVTPKAELVPVSATPPFPSHAEADAAIAKEEQAGLFER